MKTLLHSLILAIISTSITLADHLTEASPKEPTWKTCYALARHASQLSRETLYF